MGGAFDCKAWWEQILREITQLSTAKLFLYTREHMVYGV